MTLSMTKLEKLLSTKGFMCKKFYVIDGMCVYIEVLDLSTSDIFMLYIPSKYDIPVEKREGVYLIDYLDVDENGGVVGDYAGEPDDHDLEQIYDSSEIELGKDNDNKKQMRNFLEERYDNPLNLRDMGKDDIKEIRETFRHLMRLKLAVKNLKYKLCIAFKNYLCCIRRDETLEGFVVKKLVETSDRKLFVKIELDVLYENIGTLSVDIRTVREGIYSMLNKNQARHMINLQKLVLNAANASTLADAVVQKKTKLSGYLVKLEESMSKLVQSEKNTVEKLNEVREKYSSGGIGLKSHQSDVNRTQAVAKYETELSEIHRLKQEIIRNILAIKIKHENLLLRTDKIFFDNIVMMDEVIRNIMLMENL